MITCDDSRLQYYSLIYFNLLQSVEGFSVDAKTIFNSINQSYHLWFLHLFNLFILARACQYGVIGSLEKFFTWYGSLIATYPKTAILACIAVTIAGGLGLLRYLSCTMRCFIKHCKVLWRGGCSIDGYSQELGFQKKSWLAWWKLPKRGLVTCSTYGFVDWSAFQIRVHSVLFTADNVLTPGVLQTIYKQRKMLDKVTIGDKSFQVKHVWVVIAT